ncbi:hypothetical protein TOPH_03243 [Tolypocladium ophioglossoides CBS 100239]|uniref:Uncharacterized protein n=1 Tax=Tolypocladium ophioglossoides (strain CBS 100239) TaxID=1163406 RepID=A0A0L0NEM7_TOLOC|nr:hypothetical protein TOPH_03243 [Tolypocladium ophioglossoides CBS 100239]
MSTQTQQAGRKKLVHHLDTPFSTVSWPEISPDDQDTILELLCNLLSPIGQHRRAHIKPSKGKRAAKRKTNSKDGERPPANAPVPPKPEICAKVDVGFNSITKNLEELANPNVEPTDTPSQPYSMVFVARGNQSATFNCHFPKMICAASKNTQRDEKTRLVGFSKPCSDRLSSCLGVARVSSVAVERDAPGAEALWAFVQKAVPPIDISWFEGVGDSKYQATKIASVETTVGIKKARTT